MSRIVFALVVPLVGLFAVMCVVVSGYASMRAPGTCGVTTGTPLAWRDGGNAMLTMGGVGLLYLLAIVLLRAAFDARGLATRVPRLFAAFQWTTVGGYLAIMIAAVLLTLSCGASATLFGMAEVLQAAGGIALMGAVFAAVPLYGCGLFAEGEISP